MLSINAALRLSEEGIDFIKRMEGLRLRPYRDSAGKLTIGIGHLILDTDEIPENGISEDQAEQLLAEDAVEAETGVKRNVRYPLKQHQFDALVSWVFNLGSGNLARSTLLKKLNAGLVDEVPSEMEKWVYAGGRVVKGLVSRRKAEGRLFAEGRYE